MYRIKILENIVYKSFTCHNKSILNDLDSIMKLKNVNIVNFTILKDENLIKDLGFENKFVISKLNKQNKIISYIVHNCLIIMEKLDIELINIDLYIDLGMSIIFQVIYALNSLATIGLTHSDLHTENIMLKKTNEEYLIYTINNEKYKIKTFGYIAKLIDIEDSIDPLKNINNEIKRFLILCILFNERSDQKLLDWCSKNIFYNVDINYILKLFDQIYDDERLDNSYNEQEKKYDNLKMNTDLSNLFNCFLI